MLGTIGKKCKNVMLRNQLIEGAMSVVRQVIKREAKTKKEMCFNALAEQRGNKYVAATFANKTVRTAFPMLTPRTEYNVLL
jgi:transposase